MDVRAAADVPVGSVLVLVPKPDDADWLNLQRPIFSQRQLKAILFCDYATTLALADRAVDFFDWVSQHHDCPQGPPAHAVNGFRCAVAAKAPGIVWVGAESDVEGMWRVLSATFPGETLQWVLPQRDYEEIVDTIRSAGDAWVACRIRAETHLTHFRWALAEAGKRTRAIAVLERAECPGWWPVHDRRLPLDETRERFQTAGIAKPGRLAALTGLEPEAVDLAQQLLEKGTTEADLVALLSKENDPGAALAKKAYALGLVDVESVVWRKAGPPVLRGLDDAKGLQEKRAERLQSVGLALEKGKPVVAEEVGFWAAMGGKVLKTKKLPNDLTIVKPFIEASLSDQLDAKGWAHLAHSAWRSDDNDVAALWAIRSIEMSKAVLPPIREPMLRELAEIDSQHSHFLQNAASQDYLGSLKRSGYFIAILLIAGFISNTADVFLKNQTLYLGIIWLVAISIILVAGLLLGTRLLPIPITIQRSPKKHLTVRAKPGSSIDEAILIEGRTVGVHRATFAALIVELAQFLVLRGNTTEAEALLRKTLASESWITNEPAPAIPEISPFKSTEANEYVNLFLAQPGAPESLPPETRVRALRILSEAMLAQGRYEEAEDIAQKAHDQALDAPPITRPEQWRTLAILGRARVLQGRYDEGKADVQSAIQKAQEAFGKKHVEVARLLLDLARIEARHQDANATETARRAITTWAQSESEPSERDEAIKELGTMTERSASA